MPGQERRLACLIPRAGEPEDEAEADELITAHAGNRCDVFHTFGLDCAIEYEPSEYE